MKDHRMIQRLEEGENALDLAVEQWQSMLLLAKKEDNYYLCALCYEHGCEICPLGDGEMDIRCLKWFIHQKEEYHNDRLLFCPTCLSLAKDILDVLIELQDNKKGKIGG